MTMSSGEHFHSEYSPLSNSATIFGAMIQINRKAALIDCVGGDLLPGKITKPPTNCTTATAIFHFGMQSDLSVSSELRALAYSISACRAASHRSALVNS